MSRRPVAILALAGAMGAVGCVHVDRYANRCAVRNGASSEQVAAFLRDHPSVADEHAQALREASLQVGMPWDCVVALAAPVLKQERSGSSVWRLVRQHEPITPGLYPYFDGRVFYLYEHDARLAAIIERGDYNVYP